jgi:hypothetical protein
MEQLNLGFKKLEVSKQAKIAFYTWVVSFVCFILITLFKRPVGLGPAILSSVFIFVMGILTTYVVNCMVVGKCYVYSWFLVGLSIFNAVSYIFILSLGSMTAVKSKSSRRSRKSN